MTTLDTCSRITYNAGMDNKTEFVDKSGRTIHIGDVIQYRLGVNGLSGGPQRFRIIRFGKHVHAVAEHETNPNYGGIRLASLPAEYIVVVKTDYPRL